MGKKIPYHILKSKLLQMWTVTEPFPLKDLGSDYYMERFTKEENLREYSARALGL